MIRRLESSQRGLRRCALILIGLALVFGGQALWITSKAVLAQHLLEKSWQDTLASGTDHRPWPWADMVPRARLSVPELEVDHIVLADASGEAMAFGPGLVAGDPRYAASRSLVIGGHRDTHLDFVEHLGAKHVIQLADPMGRTHHYRLLDKRIVDTRSEMIALSPGHAGLVLVTCYPFNALQTGGPLRMVVTAERIDATLG